MPEAKTNIMLNDRKEGRSASENAALAFYNFSVECAAHLRRLQATGEGLTKGTIEAWVLLDLEAVLYALHQELFTTSTEEQKELRGQIARIDVLRKDAEGLHTLTRSMYDFLLEQRNQPSGTKKALSISDGDPKVVLEHILSQEHLFMSRSKQTLIELIEGLRSLIDIS